MSLHPILYSKTRVYRGIQFFFLIFALKHRSWVLNEAVLTCTHNLGFEQKYENSQNFNRKLSIFRREKSLHMLHKRVFVMFSIKTCYVTRVAQDCFL